MKNQSRTFINRLKKAGWGTYEDAETGRVVTNGYLRELKELEEISGMKCEVVTTLFGTGQGKMCRIGYVKEG